jgi:SAM-dependent methyltransferase
MLSTGSYDVARTTAGGLPGELTRLEAQAALSFAEELAVLRDLGLGSAGPLLEVGCGPGAQTRRLAAALPRMPIIALDADLGLIAHAADCPGGRLVGGDASALPVGASRLGAVLFRYVLQHVSDPLQCLAEARRVLRPGGRVFVIEVDAELWGVAEPADSRLRAVHARIAAAQRAAGGDRLIGRRLSGLLRTAGFDDVVVRPFAVTSDEHPLEDFAPLVGPGRLVPLIEDGRLTITDLALVTAAWVRFLADPAAWIMLLGLVASASAPLVRHSQ